MAEDCARTLRNYKWLQILISALTASTAFLAIVKDSGYAKWCTALLSVIGIWVTGYMAT
jgi:hypothetical protein